MKLGSIITLEQQKQMMMNALDADAKRLIPLLRLRRTAKKTCHLPLTFCLK